MAQTQRYWDGQRWTDHIAPGYPQQTPYPSAVTPAYAPAASSDSGLITAGVLTAIFLPLIGFIIGIVLLAKGKTGPGLSCMVLAIVAFLFWLAALTPDATTYDYGY